MALKHELALLQKRIGEPSQEVRDNPEWLERFRRHLRDPCYQGQADACDGCLVCRPCIDPLCGRCHPAAFWRSQTDAQVRDALNMGARAEALTARFFGESGQSAYISPSHKALYEVATERGLRKTL